MKKTAQLFILFFGLWVPAQTIIGTIVSKEDKRPIPFAKIGIENENTGSISDENGIFTIDLTDIDKHKNLKIEVGRFENYTTYVEQFVKENNRKILLTEKVKNIEEEKLIPSSLYIRIGELRRKRSEL